MPATKIATCCYCGTRAALRLDRGRHELACASCGAPLHELKMLPVQPDKAPLADRPRGAGPAPGRPATARPTRGWKVKKAKKRKGFGRRLFEEIWDVVEDIID